MSADPTVLQQQYEIVAADQLLPHPENPRRGDVDVIEDSIETNGFYGALIVQRSTGHVLVGNHRLRAAVAAGVRELPVLWVDVDDARARRILLVDNRAGDLAIWDEPALAAMLEQLLEDSAGITGTGFDQAAAEEIIAAAAVPAQLNDPDEAPDYPAQSEVIPAVGDVWVLGPHRLVVGDARSNADVDQALAGHPADLLFTDPPYGVSVVGGTSDQLTIVNDDLTPEQLAELLDASLEVAMRALRPGGAFYVCSPSGDLETIFRRALTGAQVQLRQQIVWIKDRFVLGHADYHGQHETLLYGWQAGAAPIEPPHYDVGHDTLLYGWAPGAAHTWEGGRKQSTVWEHARPQRSAEHPTMKPVELVRRAIENNTRAGALVLDPFAGAGSTLIACSDSGRRAALVELDPKYAHVICRRFQEHTGILPVLEGADSATDFTSAA